MAYASFKQFCIAAHLAREDDWDALMADWRRERAEDGLVDAFPVYLCRRNNISEIVTSSAWVKPLIGAVLICRK